MTNKNLTILVTIKIISLLIDKIYYCFNLLRKLNLCKLATSAKIEI